MRSSSVLLSLVAVALALFLFGTSLAVAQGFGEGEIGPHKDVVVRSVFPDHPSGEFPVGEVIDVLIALRNTHDKYTFNVTTAAAQIVNPDDFSMSFFNFSGFQYNRVLGPGQEAALVYKFRSDPAMEPRDFGLKLNLVYFDQYQHPYMHLAYNETISFVEIVSTFDFQSLFAFLLFGGILAVAGFFGYKSIFKKKGGAGGKIDRRKSALSASTSPETGTRTAGQVKEEYVDPRIRHFVRQRNKGGSSPK